MRGARRKRTYLTGAYVELLDLLEQECILVSDFDYLPTPKPWALTPPDLTSDGVAFDGAGFDTWNPSRPNLVVMNREIFNTDQPACAVGAVLFHETLHWDDSYTMLNGVIQERCALLEEEIEAYCCEDELLACCLDECPVLSDDEIEKTLKRIEAVQYHKLKHEEAYAADCNP